MTIWGLVAYLATLGAVVGRTELRDEGQFDHGRER